MMKKKATKPGAAGKTETSVIGQETAAAQPVAQADRQRNGLLTAILVGVSLILGIVIGTNVLPNLELPFDRAKDAVIGDARVKPESVQDDTGKYVVLDYPEFDAESYVDIADYRNMTFEIEPMPEITDEDIQDNINSYILYHEKEDLVTDGVIHEGDIVTVTYAATLDGEAVDTFSAENMMMMLGRAGEPDGFVQALDGAAIGEEISFEMTFPYDWEDEEWAGVTLSFTATPVSRHDIPELTDELAKEISDGEYGTADAFKDFIRQTITDYDSAVYNDELYGIVLERLLDESRFKTVPQDLINWYVAVNMRYFQNYADQYNMSVDDYLVQSGAGTSAEGIINELTADAVGSVRVNGILTLIADREGIQVDPEDSDDAAMIDRRVQELMAGFNMDGEDAVYDYYKQSNIYNDVRNWKVVEWLCANVKTAAPGTVADDGSEG